MDLTPIYEYLKQKQYNKIIEYIYKRRHIFIKLIKLTSNKIIKINLMNELMKKNIETDMIYIIIKTLIEYIMKKKIIKKLNGRDEIAHNNDDIFFIMVADTKTKLKLMILYFIIFYFDAKNSIKINNESYFAGIDFEFNKQKIALCQICLFTDNENKYIWIFNPHELTDIKKRIFIKYFLTSKYIYKIFQGGESLDIPYIFNKLLNNKKDCYKFIKKVIDTRFICEFQKIIFTDNSIKCSIYNALLYFNTISQNKFDYLNKLDIQYYPNFKWDIHKMNDKIINYALYDVLYLKTLLYDMIAYTKKKSIGQYNNIELITEILRLIYLEKAGVINIINDLKNKNDSLNNYVYNNKTLLDYYNELLLKIDINGIKLDDLLFINYFKSTLTTIFKYIIYNVIKNDILNNDNYFLLIHPLSEFGMTKLVRFINLLQDKLIEKFK